MLRPATPPLSSRPSAARLAARAAVLLAPAAVLAGLSFEQSGLARSIAVGVAVALAIEGLFLWSRPTRPSGTWASIGLYAVAALTLRFNHPALDSLGFHVGLAALILAGVAVVVRRELILSGSNARRARFLIRQLLARKQWPASYDAYGHCPLILALRDALHDNAGPVLPLLAHADERVRMAALCAMQFQPVWRKGQAEAVIQLAGVSTEPSVRTAVMLALVNVTKVRHLKLIAPYLRDAWPEVRRAAAVAILWDAPSRWAEIRGEVRAALSHPPAARDGPLPGSGGLPPVAIDDLIAWSGEAGPIGKRATQTLVRHCRKSIAEDGSPEAIARVTDLVTSAKVPPAIRVELAHRLQSSDVLSPDVAGRLLGPANPTMLRVLAAGAILSDHEDPLAVEVLREAAKQPNREICLASAALVQKYLSVDLGLEVGGEVPATNTREAAEVARRVLKWASDPGSQVMNETPVDAFVADPADKAYF